MQQKYDIRFCLFYVRYSTACCGFHRPVETRWPLHTGASVAPVTASVFGHLNCHRAWKHITLHDEMLVLENSAQ